MSVKSRVSTTPNSVVGDTEIQHQRHRTRHIREVTSQFDVPTSLTPAPSHLLRFHLMCCAKEVSNLISRPVVSLLGTRVGGTSTKIVPQRIQLELLATTILYSVDQDTHSYTVLLKIFIHLYSVAQDTLPSWARLLGTSKCRLLKSGILTRRAPLSYLCRWRLATRKQVEHGVCLCVWAGVSTRK